MYFLIFNKIVLKDVSLRYIKIHGRISNLYELYPISKVINFILNINNNYIKRSYLILITK